MGAVRFSFRGIPLALRKVFGEVAWHSRNSRCLSCTWLKPGGERSVALALLLVFTEVLTSTCCETGISITGTRHECRHECSARKCKWAGEVQGAAGGSLGTTGHDWPGACRPPANWAATRRQQPAQAAKLAWGRYHRAGKARGRRQGLWWPGTRCTRDSAGQGIHIYQQTPAAAQEPCCGPARHGSSPRTWQRRPAAKQGQNSPKGQEGDWARWPLGVLGSPPLAVCIKRATGPPHSRLAASPWLFGATRTQGEAQSGQGVCGPPPWGHPAAGSQ